MAAAHFRIGAVPDLYCRPLIYGLKLPKSPAQAGLSIGTLLRASQESGLTALPQLAARQGESVAMPEDAIEEQLGRYSYGFEGEDREGMGEFFRYAFYLGKLPDLPERDLHLGYAF